MSRRNALPRKSSPAGIERRFGLRRKAFHAMKPPTKFAKGYHEPGSVNPRKVGR